MASLDKDIIIVGGGIGGSVLSSRLAQCHPELQILLVEAGKDVSQHPLTSAPLDAFAGHFSELDWAYSTVPQTHLGNRRAYAAAGKALSGGSATNYGTWTRGNAADFDQWASLVEDPAWSYQGWLEYFKRTENYHEGNGKDFMDQHGFAGPITAESISSSSTCRKYPLREPLKAAWSSIGVKESPDGNNGQPMGRAELVENFNDGKRQLASEAYGLSTLKNIEILTDTLVKGVIVEQRNGKKVAVGIETTNGTQYRASKEVVVSAGAYRTPQVLQLSGIGPANILEEHKIPVVIDAPEVGRNFHDHLAVCQWWKLRKTGLAIGTSDWTDPAFYKGLPGDWVVTQKVPRGMLKAAIGADGEKVEGHYLLGSDVAHTETLVVYAPAGAQLANVEVPMDGTHIASCVLVMTPTSRGSVLIAGPDPTAMPLIDPNYGASNVDRMAMREGMRSAMEVLSTPKHAGICRV